MERIRDAFQTIKKDYIIFLYGLVLGFVLFLLISLQALNFTIFLQLANLIITAMIATKFFFKPHNPDSKPQTKKGNPCPECGSTRRHLKTCSRGRKK